MMAAWKRLLDEWVTFLRRDMKSKTCTLFRYSQDGGGIAVRWGLRAPSILRLIFTPSTGVTDRPVPMYLLPAAEWKQQMEANLRRFKQFCGLPE